MANGTNTASVITSCMILSWPNERPACWKPMRLAGTCSRYSASAMPQLISAAMYQGAVARFFRWPYQAMVMKTLDATSSRMACNENGTEESMFMGKLSAAEPTGPGPALVYSDPHLLVFDKPAGLLSV